MKKATLIQKPGKKIIPRTYLAIFFFRSFILTFCIKVSFSSITYRVDQFPFFREKVDDTKIVCFVISAKHLRSSGCRIDTDTDIDTGIDTETGDRACACLASEAAKVEVGLSFDRGTRNLSESLQ